MKYEKYLQDINPEELTQQVQNWSNLCTGSYHTEGLQELCERLTPICQKIPGTFEKITLPDITHWTSNGSQSISSGPLLRIKVRPHCSRKVLLAIHTDTVFSPNHPFQKCQLQKEILHGPGVCDAKAGIAILLKSLELLENSPWATNIGYTILLNPDEEIGSPVSAKYFEEEATKHDFALLFEPSLPNGNLVSHRKGSGNFSLEVFGKAAHAGRCFHEGHNAILELQRWLQELNALNFQYSDLTCNIASVHGGGPTNVVPDYALARYNIRMESTQTMKRVQNKLIQLQKEFKTEPFQYAFHGHFNAPPKPFAAKLGLQIQKLHQKHGLHIDFEKSGGVCDGNRLSSFGLPNIDTLGGIGGNIHSNQEYLEINSLVSKTKITAELLMQYASGDWTYGGES